MEAVIALEPKGNLIIEHPHEPSLKWIIADATPTSITLLKMNKLYPLGIFSTQCYLPPRLDSVWTQSPQGQLILAKSGLTIWRTGSSSTASLMLSAALSTYR